MIGTEAMVAEAQPMTEAQMQAEVEELKERRRRVEAELKAPEVPNTPLDEVVRDRRRKADLEIELAVIDERLAPLVTELARRETEAVAAEAAAKRAAMIATALEALTKVTAARDVLDAEVDAFVAAMASFPRGRLGRPPEVHFASRNVVEAIVLVARRLEGAA